jgi:N-acyl-D-aspartate/D-glutamate deacylase
MNAVITVGFNVVRREVMGDDFLRPATPDEIEQMRARVRQGMEEGAFGISVGLEYEGLNVHARGSSRRCARRSASARRRACR